MALTGNLTMIDERAKILLGLVFVLLLLLVIYFVLPLMACFIFRGC